MSKKFESVFASYTASRGENALKPAVRQALSLNKGTSNKGVNAPQPRP